MAHRGRAVLLTAASVGAVVVAVLLLPGAAGSLGSARGPGSGEGSADVRSGSSGAQSAPAPGAGSGKGASGGFRSPRTYPAVAEPMRLRIPAIGVNTSLERLGRAADGTVETPERWEMAGWYAQGPRPGQAGPAVLLGHVDSRSGPAVFYDLARLRPGDAVVVERADGTAARFRVTGRLQVAKSQFPSDLVYGASLQPSLRLVTCGGTFDTATGHYRDNVIVSAVPA